MLTPSRFWSSRETPSEADSDELQSAGNGSEIRSSNVSERGTFTFPPPVPAPRPNLGKLPSALEGDNRLQQPGESSPVGGVDRQSFASIAFPQASPNEKLKEFFRSKGDEKLSDVEVAGVLALIQQASHRNESLLDQYSPSTEKCISTLHSVSTSPVLDRDLHRQSDHLFRGHREIATPIRSNSQVGAASSIPSPRYIPLYTSHSRTANPNRSGKVRKTYHYNSLPTPYRPGLKRSLGSLVTVSRNDSRNDSEIERRDEVNEMHGQRATPAASDLSMHSESTISDVEMERGLTKLQEDDTEKPLSDTASTLLSLLDSEKKQTPQSTKEDRIPQDMKQFVSPYAAKRRLSTPRKQVSSGRSEPALRSPPVRELEISRPKDKSYKPVKSSSLRQSLVPSPGKKDDEAVDLESTESPKALFIFQQKEASAGGNEGESKIGKSENVIGKEVTSQHATGQNVPSQNVADQTAAAQPFDFNLTTQAPPTFKFNSTAMSSSSNTSTDYPKFPRVSPSKPLFASVEAASPQIVSTLGESPQSTKESPFCFGISKPMTCSVSRSTGWPHFAFPEVPTVSGPSLSQEDEATIKSLRETVFQF